MKFCIAVFVITFFASASGAIDSPAFGILGELGGQQDGIIRNIIDTAVKIVFPGGALIKLIREIDITQLSPVLAAVIAQLRQTLDLTDGYSNPEVQLNAVITGLTNVAEQILREIAGKVFDFFASQLSLLQSTIQNLFDAVQAAAIEVIGQIVAQISQTIETIYTVIAGIIKNAVEFYQNVRDSVLFIFAVLSDYVAKALNAAQEAIERIPVDVSSVVYDIENLQTNINQRNAELIAII